MKTTKQKRIKAKDTIGRRFLNLFKSVDMYGKNIVLHYKGHETYNTHIGGVVSFIILGVLTAYFFILLKVLLNRQNTNFSKNSFEKDLNNDGTVHNIGQNNIIFGVSLSDGNGNQILNNSTVISYTVNQVSQKYIENSDGTTSLSRNKTAIQMKECGKRFTKVADSTVQRIEADTIA